MSTYDRVELAEVALANLDKLADGDVGAAVKREVEKAVSDLIDYGDDGLVRKVTIELAMKQRRQGDRVEIAVSVAARLPSVPVRKTQAVFSTAAKDPRLFFNPASAANPGQLTIDSLVGGEGG